MGYNNCNFVLHQLFHLDREHGPHTYDNTTPHEGFFVKVTNATQGKKNKTQTIFRECNLRHLRQHRCDPCVCYKNVPAQRTDDTLV